MDYNTTRKKLIIPEYGRHIHKMVEYIKTVPSKEKRNQLAYAVVNIMASIHPGPKGNDISDLKRRMWDYVFIIADFDLDIDSPFPKPTREKLMEKPRRIPYPQAKISLRHYGKILEGLIGEATQFEEGPEKDHLVEVLANQMKKLYLTWNRDSVTDEAIFADLRKLSGGRLNPPANLELSDYKEMQVKKPKKKPQKVLRNEDKKGRHDSSSGFSGIQK
jgi:hypothetical protein